MEGSQNYIGIPNGIVLCVDQRTEQRLKGRFYHFYSESAMEFVNMDELVFKMETFFNDINFPYPSNSQRVFGGRTWKGRKPGKCGGTEESSGLQESLRLPENRRQQERRMVMKEEELLCRHGDIGTFIIRVQQRQNCSWQGRITWSDKNQTVNFRSIWEMIRLIEDALNTVSQQEGGADSNYLLPSFESQ